MTLKPGGLGGFLFHLTKGNGSRLVMQHRVATDADKSTSVGGVGLFDSPCSKCTAGESISLTQGAPRRSSMHAAYAMPSHNRARY